jgi:succinoglycan biosynthesis protein ExoV
MEVWFWESKEGNFGDDLNRWIWDDLLPGHRSWGSEAVIVGIGTILIDGFLPKDRLKVVIGSGVGYGVHKASLMRTP